MKTTAHDCGCGATISNVDLTQLTRDQATEINQLLAQHGVLIFNGQNVTPDDHVRLANTLGDIVLNPFFKALDTHPEVAIVAKSEKQSMNIGGGWHTDHSYEPEPAKGSILVARTVPSAGGDTRFAHLGKAYETLPEHVKQQILPLNAVHSNKHIYGAEGYYRNTDQAANLGGVDDVGDATHPMVIKHPQSGNPILYVNPAHVVAIEGLEDQEAKELLDLLYRHVVEADFIYDHCWTEGSVAIWDNRTTWHFANNDYQGEKRLMHRITLTGDPLEAFK
ncbi:MAG: TauD/TfdA family dioxygenase [Gammaproteobacteria bacterium]|nr:TauD/TfdA family dioxygenase [Gammaproteobacteria bacterium]